MKVLLTILLGKVEDRSENLLLMFFAFIMFGVLLLGSFSVVANT